MNVTYNLPTLLTFLRIALIPVFVVLYYYSPLWSAILLIAASATDWLDGYLARKLDQMTEFGAFLDPIADKLLVLITIVLVVGDNPTSFPDVYVVMTGVVLVAREIMVSALREWAARLNKAEECKVGWLGKVKTAVQMVSLILISAQYSFGNWFKSADIGVVLLIFSVLLSVWSMVIYAKGFFKEKVSH